MKTSPTPRARHGSTKSTKNRDRTQGLPKSAPGKAASEARREARRQAREEEEPEGEGERTFRKPAVVPKPVFEPGCTRDVQVSKFSAVTHKVLTAKGCAKLTELAAVDRSKAVMAFVIGVSKSQLDTLINTNEAAKEAYELGRGMFEDRFTDGLMTMCDQGNVAAAIWVEKTRMGKRDNTPVSDGTRHVHIHLPESVSPEQYMASLALTHADSHQKVIEESKEEQPAPALQAHHQGKLSWIPTSGEALPDPTDDELRKQIEEAMAPAPAQQPPPVVPIPPDAERADMGTTMQRIARLTSFDR